MKYAILGWLVVLSFACIEKDDAITQLEEETTLYFPPLDSDEWETISPNTLNWNTTALDQLLRYLEDNNTRAFIVLKDGKMVIEEYFGDNFLETADFDQNSKWYWASAGKTITATLVGIAQQEGFIDITHPTSDYLGTGWTSLNSDKEALITLKHQLSMTTGLSYNTNDLGCTLPACLTYGTDAGQQWYYHNAPYTLLKDVLENATGMDYNDYTHQKLESQIGMNGQWIAQGENNVYWSSARDMARFGLLMLNKGKWDDTAVLADTNNYNQMRSSSQNLNPSYGYLWWLNGKSSIILPSFTSSVNASLAANAPEDLIAGMGKNGQFVEVIPSQNLVVIRMGEAPDNALVPILFHDEMWEKISLVLNQ